MNMALILTAVQYGAVAANHTEVVDLLKDSQGRINGCKMRDVITGREWETKSKVSVCCSQVLGRYRSPGLD